MTALLVAGIVLLAIGGCCLAYGVCGLLDSHREGGAIGSDAP